MIKKIIYRSLIVFAGIIILLLILLPGIAKRYVVSHSKKLVGRQIALEKLKINLFTGTVKMIDFKMFESDDKEVFVSFDTLLINSEPYRYIRNDLVVEQFYLKGLKAKIIQNDSLFNFNDLIAFFTSPEDTIPKDTIASEPLHFQFSNIELKGAELIYDNRTMNKTTTLNDLSFSIPYIGWNQKEKSKAGLKFDFKNEGYFESSINVDPVGGDFEANIKVYHLYLKAFQDYVANFANINLFQGMLNSNLNIAGNMNYPEKSIVSGSMEVLDFLMKDKQDKKFLGSNKMACKFKSIDYYNSSYIIDSVILSQPYVYFEMDSVTNNFFKVFNISPGAEDSTQVAETAIDPAASDSSGSLYYAINHLVLRDGIVDYTDNLTGEPFKYHLSGIKVNSDSLLSSSDWVNIYSNMLLNNRGKLVAEVGFDPENPSDIKLDYTITHFQLSDLNIYSRFYVGFPIMYGDMYYKSHTEIIHNQLKSDNKLIIQNAELGEKTRGLFDLPMKFALFLLTDKNGIINLDIPVRGNLNDPTVSVGKIIWTTFKNLIVKVATAPIGFLANLISVDPKDIKAIEYNYLDTTFTSQRQKQLDLLLELEKKKGGLKIELVYFNDVDIERKQIAVNEAGRLFMSETGKNYPSDEKDFIHFLKEKTKADSIDIAEASKKLVPAATIDSLTLLFAQTRKNSLEKYLRTKNDSTQISFIIPDPQSPKNTGSIPLFETKYSLSDAELEKK
jgi:hypothetical protein